MSRTQNRHLMGINEHLKILQDFIFTLGNEYEVPNAMPAGTSNGHLQISKCEYEISPNLGMLVNAREVPIPFTNKISTRHAYVK